MIGGTEVYMVGGIVYAVINIVFLLGSFVFPYHVPYLYKSFYLHILHIIIFGYLSALQIIYIKKSENKTDKKKIVFCVVFIVAVILNCVCIPYEFIFVPV